MQCCGTSDKNLPIVHDSRATTGKEMTKRQPAAMYRQAARDGDLDPMNRLLELQSGRCGLAKPPAWTREARGQ